MICLFLSRSCGYHLLLDMTPGPLLKNSPIPTITPGSGGGKGQENAPHLQGQLDGASQHEVGPFSVISTQQQIYERACGFCWFGDLLRVCGSLLSACHSIPAFLVAGFRGNTYSV